MTAEVAAEILALCAQLLALLQPLTLLQPLPLSCCSPLPCYNPLPCYCPLPCYRPLPRTLLLPLRCAQLHELRPPPPWEPRATADWRAMSPCSILAPTLQSRLALRPLPLARTHT